jgi:hypothetical protein
LGLKRATQFHLAPNLGMHGAMSMFPLMLNWAQRH